MARKTKPTPPVSRLWRTKQVTAETGISERTLYRKADEGLLTIWKIGHITFWDTAELDALVTRGRIAS